jgi:chorismate-pyruvate lyase
MSFRAFLFCLLLLGASYLRSAEADHTTIWKDTSVTRLKTLALLETLHADLLMAKSATLVLEAWCKEHRQSSDPKIQAIRDSARQKPAPAEVKELLKVKAQETIRYRSVKLACGTHIFSEADNWFVPERLTPLMNERLEKTDTPFGVAVKDLNFTRRTIIDERLWSPMEKGWEMKELSSRKTQHPLKIPTYVLRTRAALSMPDQSIFSVVDETYRHDLFDFRPSP